MTEADAVTDISEHSWDDLIDADYELVQSLGKEIDSIDGRWGQEKIVAYLFNFHGRLQEIPEDVRADVFDGDESEPEETDTTADERKGETHAVEGEGDEGDESEDEDGEDDPEPVEAEESAESDSEDAESGGDSEDEEFGAGANPEPRGDASFIVKADRITGWLEYVHVLVDEAKIHLRDDGFRTRAVDPANVGMVDSRLETTAFESYDITNEGVIGMNTNRLYDVLGHADDDELVNLEYDHATKKVVVSYGRHQFTIALIDPASIRQEPDLPDLNLPVDADVDAGEISEAVSLTDEVTDHIKIESRSDPDVLEFYGEGDTDDYTWTGEAGEEVHFNARPTEDVSSLFSLDYLKDMVKPFDNDQTVNIRLGQEFPTKMETTLGDDDETWGEAVYMLAPRIQSD